MTKPLHTLMLTVAAVSLSAGAALAADNTMDTSATMDSSASSSAAVEAPTGQAQTQMDMAAQTDAGASTSANQVESVQAKLSQEGFPVSVDGVWGPKSADALRQFQQANSLDSSGQINAETLAALEIDASASSATANR